MYKRYSHQRDCSLGVHLLHGCSGGGGSGDVYWLIADGRREKNCKCWCNCCYWRASIFTVAVYFAVHEFYLLVISQDSENGSHGNSWSLCNSFRTADKKNDEGDWRNDVTLELRFNYRVKDLRSRCSWC